MIEAFTRLLDWLSQHITSADLVIQTPLVFIPSLVLCVILAFILVRVVDFFGYLVYPLCNGGKPRPRRGTKQTQALVRATKDDGIVVLQGPVANDASGDPQPSVGSSPETTSQAARAYTPAPHYALQSSAQRAKLARLVMKGQGGAHRRTPGEVRVVVDEPAVVTPPQATPPHAISTPARPTESGPTESGTVQSERATSRATASGEAAK